MFPAIKKEKLPKKKKMKNHEMKRKEKLLY